jgi:hypothetical protein
MMYNKKNNNLDTTQFNELDKNGISFPKPNQS